MRILNAFNDGGNTITLICREGDKKFTRTIDHCYPYFCIKTPNLHRTVVQEAINKREISEVEYEPNFVKLFTKRVIMIKVLRDMLEKENIETFESDIPFFRRVMIDKLMEVGTEPLRFLFIDIETDDSLGGIEVGRDRILSIASIDQKGKKSFFLNDDEKIILSSFKEHIKEYDVLVAWNGNNFDFPYLEKRFEKNKIWVDWRYWQRLDMMDICKSKIKTFSYSLDNIAKLELGLEKIKHSEKIIEMFNSNRQKLMEYNVWDVELMKKLEDKMSILKFYETMSEKTNVFLEEVSYNSVIVDNMIMRKCKELRMPIRFKRKQQTLTKPYKGGFVLTPKGGLHKNVIILDFTSLYNRGMQTFNISPETLDLKGEITIPDTNIKFKRQKGIVPYILETLEKERNNLKKLRNTCDPKGEDYKRYDMLQNAVKTTLLSFYGVIGSPRSRYYHSDIAGSVAGIGRYLVNKSKDFVEKLGFEVLYMDTDSLMIKLQPDEIDEQIKIGNLLKDKLNDFYKEDLKQYGIPLENNKIEIKFEKIFEKIIFMGSEEKGTKKRYCAKQVYEEGRKILKMNFVGIEIARTDWSSFAQKMQKEVISYCIEGMAIDFIKNWLVGRYNQVKNGELQKEDLTVWQMLTKRISDYKTDIPHIKVAKDMQLKGREVFVGNKIPMIFIKSEKKPIPIHPDDYFKGYDGEYYWQNRLYPPTERVLKATFPNEDWNSFYNLEKVKSSQKTLI